MEQVLQVNVIAVTFVASWVIPLLVAVLTKSSASSSVKAVLNLVLTVALAVCTCIITAKGSVTVGQITTAIMAAFTGSGLSYTHLWKPTGATANVASVAPEFGLGTSKPIETTATEGGSTTTKTTDTSFRTTTTSTFTPDSVEVAVSEPAPADPPDGAETVAPLSAHGARIMADNSLLTGEPMLVLLTPVLTSPEV